MNSTAKGLIKKSQQWLKEDVFPLWIQQGVDKINGGFFESLSAEGFPQEEHRRALVQGRQIYSFTEAAKMKIISDFEASQIVDKGLQFLIKSYLLPSGAFVHAVDRNGNPVQHQSELYTQAFVLFSLARGYAQLNDPLIKKTAQNLLKFLKSERKNRNGGYSEVKSGKIVFQSNPHMHLFEAAIEWMKVDSDLDWKILCQELFELAQNKFIDLPTGLLAEHFDEFWQPQHEDNHFIFEPGHQYEWAWLFLQYEKISGVQVGDIPKSLFNLAEEHGVHRPSGYVFDEIRSDFKIKKSSSRFWPQCERIKTAIELGYRANIVEQSQYAQTADEALMILWNYFYTNKKGLWHDTKLESGEFKSEPSKSSSLYHIINAISEYCEKRPFIQD